MPGKIKHGKAEGGREDTHGGVGDRDYSDAAVVLNRAMTRCRLSNVSLQMAQAGKSQWPVFQIYE